MIAPVINDALVSRSGYRTADGKIGWAVVHPTNGAILAYCDTEAEARAYKEALNDLPRQLRAVGVECK